MEDLILLFSSGILLGISTTANCHVFQHTFTFATYTNPLRKKMPLVLCFDDYKIMEQKKNKLDFQDLPDNIVLHIIMVKDII